MLDAILKGAFFGSLSPTVLYDLDGLVLACNPAADAVLEGSGMRSGPELLGSSWPDAFPHLRDSPFEHSFALLAEGADGDEVVVPAVRMPGTRELRLRRMAEAIAVYFVQTTPSDVPPDVLTLHRAQLDDRRGLQTLRDGDPYGAMATFTEDFMCEQGAGRGWEELGVDAGSLDGRGFSEVFPTEIAEEFREVGAVALAGYQVNRRLQFEGRHHQVWAGPISANGCARGMFLVRDVTAEVNESRWRRIFHAAIDATPKGIIVTELDGLESPIVFVNRGFETTTGYSAREVLGRDCRLLQGPDTDPDDIDALRVAIDARQGVVRTLLNYRKDGTTFWNRLVLSPVSLDGEEVTHYVGVQEDVTELREAAQEREHLDRLSHIGEFAGGVAHDFNNLLLEISGWTELALERRSDTNVKADLENIAMATSRAQTLVRHLLRYAGRRSTEPAQEDRPFSSLEAILPGLHRIAPRGVRVEMTRTAARDVALRIDAVRLEQILLNLVKNASDAMPDGGVVTLDAISDTRSGIATISVTDTGAGMSPDVRAHAFDRFFTTKGEEGTGLGLASVSRILADVGGTVAVESEEGSGTTIRMTIPLAPDASAVPDPSGGARTVDEDEDEASEGGRGPEAAVRLAGLRVLLVEDESDVRGILRRVLERRGLVVDAFPDGRDALAAYREAPFDVVVTDCEMPRLDGVSLLGYILDDPPAADGAVPFCVLMSGDLKPPGDLPASVRFLSKPFPVEHLIGAIEGWAVEHSV